MCALCTQDSVSVSRWIRAILITRDVIMVPMFRLSRAGVSLVAEIQKYKNGTQQYKQQQTVWTVLVQKKSIIKSIFYFSLVCFPSTTNNTDICPLYIILPISVFS